MPTGELPAPRRDPAAFYDRWTPVMVAAAGTTLQGGLVKRSPAEAEDPEASAVYLAELAGVAPGDRVLDAGCGVAGPAMAIARAIPGVAVEAVTISAVQARMARAFVARAGLAGDVRVTVADYHALPFADGVFDVVLFLEVTGYSADRFALYREAARVLRPGGTVYVKDLFRREDPLTTEQHESLAAFDELWGCVASPTLGETAAALRAALFAAVSVREYPFVGMDRYFESMVSRDKGGLRLNAFGKAFLRQFPDLPVFFGEARGVRPRGG